MPCEAKTYSDGSWVCWVCDIGGDHDEDPADFCKRKSKQRCIIDGSPGAVERYNAETDGKPAKR